MTAFPRRPGGGVAAWPRLLPVGDPLIAIASAALATAVIAAVAVAAVLLVRRLVGGFAVSPPAGIAWLVAAAGIAFVAAADAAVRSGLVRRWVAFLGRSGLVLAAVAVFPGVGTGPEGLPGLAAICVAAGTAFLPPPGAAGRRRHRPAARSRGMPAVPVIDRPPAPPWDPPPPHPGGLPAALLPPGIPLAADCRQRFERFTTEAGHDRVVGQVMVELAVGSRTGHAHVGFCPPFLSTPAVEVTTDYDGVEAVVSAAEVLPWGVRVECRLSEPAEEAVTIPVTIHAHLLT